MVKCEELSKSNEEIIKFKLDHSEVLTENNVLKEENLTNVKSFRNIQNQLTE